MMNLEVDQELAGCGQDIPLTEAQNHEYCLIAVGINLHKQLNLCQGKKEYVSMSKDKAGETDHGLTTVNLILKNVRSQ